MNDAKFIRLAGYNERRCIARDTLGLYGSIVTVGRYTTSKLQPWPSLRDALILALKHCLVQHPVLSIIVQGGETERPKLAKLSAIDLNDHIHTQDVEASREFDEETLQAFLEGVHNEPFVERHKQPQWRVYVLSRTEHQSSNFFYLAFASSHALVDGASHMQFHHTLLRGLQDVPCDGPDVNMVWHRPSVEIALPPALNNAGTFAISWSFLLGPLLNEFLPAVVTRALVYGPDLDAVVWLGASKRPERKQSEQLLPTSVRVALIQPEVLQEVIAACRRRDARLTGLLNRLIACALFNALHARDQTYTTSKAETAIDMRRCLPGSEVSMANYVSVVPESINVTRSTQAFSDEDWTAVQRSTELLDKASRTLSNQPIALLRYISNFHAWTAKNATKPATASFDMSNLGVFDGRSSSDGREWQVKEMMFSQSANGTGAPLGVNLASAKNGSLSIVVTWWPGMLGVDDEGGFVDELLADTVEQMRLISEGEG